MRYDLATLEKPKEFLSGCWRLIRRHRDWLWCMYDFRDMPFAVSALEVEPIQKRHYKMYSMITVIFKLHFKPSLFYFCWCNVTIVPFPFFLITVTVLAQNRNRSRNCREFQNSVVPQNVVQHSRFWKDLILDVSTKYKVGGQKVGRSAILTIHQN